MVDSYTNFAKNINDSTATPLRSGFRVVVSRADFPFQASEISEDQHYLVLGWTSVIPLANTLIIANGVFIETKSFFLNFPHLRCIFGTASTQEVSYV
jgi:hypothetical protein